MKAKLLLLTLTLSLISIAVIGQAANAPPTIPPALITKYFKAHAESADARVQFAQAQSAVQQKAQAEQQIIAELQTACGEKFIAQLSATGDPVCVIKPTPKAEVKK